MKDMEVAAEDSCCPEALDGRRRIQNMAIKSENCHQRLQALQTKFHAMEELVSNMVQYKAKIGQLKQERFNLSVTYEENLQKYRVQVSELERENMMLLNDLKKLEAQCLPNEPQEENHALLERLKILESKNSHLVLENDRQRVQYEKCLDEIANQVVQALIVQKTLKEECCQLQERVHGLEIQNQQLNLLFQQHHVRQPAESVLKSYEENLPRMSTPPPWLREQLTAHSDKLNAFSDRLSMLSDHVTEAQIKAANQESMAQNEYLTLASNPADKPSPCNAATAIVNPSSRGCTAAHLHDNLKSKQYATVRPLNCQQLPSLNGGESAISQEQSGWKMDFATISKGLTHQFDQDMYSDDETETETVTLTQKSPHMSVLSPSDILENSLDALPTPENETGHEEPFPVFRSDICRKKHSATQMSGEFEKFEKTRSREKLSEPRKRCSCQGVGSHPKSLSHDGAAQTIIPNISRPDTLDLSPPLHHSDSPSQEDSQTSPLSPYLTKRYSRKKANGFNECENNCCKPRHPSTSSSAASHYSNTTGSRHKSRKDDQESQKGNKSTKNSNYYSPEDPHPSYMAFLAPFQQKELHPTSKKLPACAYGYSKSRDAEIRHSKIYHNGLEHTGQNLPFPFNKKTLPDVYLACSEWRKNVMSACAMDGEEMKSELKKLCSISSDSSYESIKAEHSGSKDDGYSTMSSDMNPEMLERYSDSAMAKRMSGRNSFELNVDCCGKIVPHVIKSSNVVSLSRNNCVSRSPTDSEHSSDLNGASELFNSQEFFSSSTIVSNNRQSLAARKKQEARFHAANLHAAELHSTNLLGTNHHAANFNGNGRGTDNCTNTFPKFCCPSKRKSLLEASTSSSLSSSFHQSAKSLHCSSDYSPSLESSTRSSFLMPDAANATIGLTKMSRKLCQSVDLPDCKKAPSYSRYTFPSSMKFQTSMIKRAQSDSHLFVKNSSKSISSLRDSLLFGNLDNSISDCTISLSDLSPSRSSQSPIPGSLRRSPWQPLVNVDREQENKLSVQSKWLQKKFVSKTEHSPYNENKLHHTLGGGNPPLHSLSAVDHTLSACHTSNNSKISKESFVASSPFQSPDETRSAEQWLLQFSKEDIEKNLAFYQKRQNQTLHNGHNGNCARRVEDDHTLYCQTLQHKPHPKKIPVSRYMTLPICTTSSGQADLSQGGDGSIPVSPVSPVDVEEQKKFRQDFYSLCCVESNRSLFSGCSYEEMRVPKLLPLPLPLPLPVAGAKSEEACYDCTESDIQAIESVSQQIDKLSKTVLDLHLSFSSLNSIECNSDVGSDLLTPPSGRNSSLEGYHWVEDEFYLTPSSGDILFSNNNSNESSASCEWMNEYVDESCEVFDLPDACDDEQQFMEKLCAVANKLDEGKISGGKEKLSTPEKEVEDILVTNPQTRADLLDAMIDMSPSNGSDDSSNDDRLSVSKFKNKKGRQKTSAQTSPSLNFQKLFTRFGHQEEEAVSAFDFLDQFSTSSANSEPPLAAASNLADYVANIPPEFQTYSPLSDPDVTPQASPKKHHHRSKQCQPPSKKALKHMENCSRSNQAKAAAAAASAAAPSPQPQFPSTSSHDLCRSYSTCSLESPEDGSASNLSLSDSCCE